MTGVKLSLFADNMATYTTSMSKRLAIVRLQHYANMLAEFFDRWKLKVNAQRTDLIISTRKRKRKRFPIFTYRINQLKLKLMLNILE